ncbi:unnamed protein product [Mytilus coruscus]|uniref:Uncharacterized protein n=1 Tax=Mytilus coruscus TaxID=42192 RepID=A0A6J8EG54_MYTCO|nr:unnamed protein product [Mytilus coruscus]
MKKLQMILVTCTVSLLPDRPNVIYYMQKSSKKKEELNWLLNDLKTNGDIASPSSGTRSNQPTSLCRCCSNCKVNCVCANCFSFNDENNSNDLLSREDDFLLGQFCDFEILQRPRCEETLSTNLKNKTKMNYMCRFLKFNKDQVDFRHQKDECRPRYTYQAERM